MDLNLRSSRLLPVLIAMATLTHAVKSHAGTEDAYPSLRVAREIARVLKSQEVKIALKGHRPKHLSYSTTQILLNADSCTVSVRRVTNAVIPMQDTFYVEHISVGCSDPEAVDERPYLYDEWMKMMSSAAFADLGDWNVYSEEINYKAPDIFTINCSDGSILDVPFKFLRDDDSAH